MSDCTPVFIQPNDSTCGSEGCCCRTFATNPRSIPACFSARPLNLPSCRGLNEFKGPAPQRPVRSGPNRAVYCSSKAEAISSPITMSYDPANASAQFKCGFCGHIDDAVSLQKHHFQSHSTLFDAKSPARLESVCPRRDCLCVVFNERFEGHLNQHSRYDAGKLLPTQRCDDCRLEIDNDFHFKSISHHLTSFLRHTIPISSHKPSLVKSEFTQIAPTSASLDKLAPSLFTSPCPQQVATYKSNAQHLSQSNSQFKHSSIGTEDRGDSKRERTGEAEPSYPEPHKLAPT